MNDQGNKPEKAARLRQQAEKLTQKKSAILPENLVTLSPEEVQQLLYDLQVHQIELEMQNEELRSSQTKLDAARERYFDLYDLAPIGYFTLSEQGLVLEANLTAAGLLGIPREMLVNRPLGRFILREDQDIYYRHTKKVFETSESQNCDLRMQRNGGIDFWAHLTTSIVQDLDGMPVYRTTMSDITESKQAEAEKEKLQDQLLQAQKMESVGRLAGGIAHDFNNLLGIIIGHAETALAIIPPNQAGHQDLEEIIKAVKRSADLISQLLAFSRKQIINPTVVNLNDTISNMLKMLKRLIGEDIELLWKPDLNLKSVLIDPVQVDQVLVNLLINARDAITGVGKIVIETSNVVIEKSDTSPIKDLADGEYVLLTVSDTGRCMDEGIISHLFEPFFTTKELGKGTGLGLATTFGIIKQNNGNIYVSSEPGKGTTFKIFLPCCNIENVPAAPIIGKVATPHMGIATILMVEDEEDLLYLSMRALKKLGYAVLATSNPLDALRLMQEHAGSIDLLISDVIMPKMNGKELLRQIHLIQPDLRCLFMSGYTADIIVDHGVLDEGIFFIQKPFLLKDMANMVSQILGENNSL